MSEPAGRKLGLAGVAAAVLAVVCCAAGPLLVAFVGSLALGALVGVGVGACLLVAALAAIYARRPATVSGQEPE